MRSRTGEREAAFSPLKESPVAEKVAAEKWEVRPGGMLVQMRKPDDDATATPVPTIRVKVKYGGAYHEVYVSSRASFGDLKKALSARTGLHPQDMKIVYKDKERESRAFLDAAGLKDRSKVVLEDDPTAKVKRLLELRKTHKLEKAAKSISAISLDVDRLASKVKVLETIVNRGGKVVENDLNNLIECLMTELIKLDAVVADGDVKQQRKAQIKTVQKQVETLDLIKIKNATPGNGQLSKGRPQSPHEQVHQLQDQPQQPLLHSIQPHYNQQIPQPKEMQQPLNPFLKENRHLQLTTRPQFQKQTLAAATNWEPFDLLTPTPTTTHTSAAATPYARFDWELF